MFKVGDYVKVVKGLHNGSEGTVVKISKNDMGTITYEIHVEKLFKRIGNISKREGELKMAKRGRPVKNANKIEELKEVTKQVVEMAEAEPKTEGEPKPTAAVDEPVEVVDKTVEVVDEVVEVVDEVAIEPKSESEAYDQLREVYDELCKKLTFVELSSFYDIVAKDMKTSKYVLEQMYQMSIEQLAKIREEIA